MKSLLATKQVLHCCRYYYFKFVFKYSFYINTYVETLVAKMQKSRPNSLISSFGQTFPIILFIYKFTI